MSSAAGLYISVINDVVASVRDSFLDESVDENVLQELKQLWMAKLDASKTIEPTERTSQQQSAALESKMATGRSGGASASGGRGGAYSGGGASSAVANRQAAQHNGAMAGGAAGGTSQQSIVITDPSRLVPVQITIPAQPGNPASQPRALTVQVPAHALQPQGASSALLQGVLTQAITQALTLPESHAAVFLQTQINHAFNLR